MAETYELLMALQVQKVVLEEPHDDGVESAIPAKHKYVDTKKLWCERGTGPVNGSLKQVPHASCLNRHLVPRYGSQ